MSNKKKWHASYDLDGSFDIFQSDEEYPETWGHHLGPCDTFGEAKREVVAAFRHCIMELREGIIGAQRKKKPKPDSLD